MTPKIIHKDRYILVIDKPAGLPTVDAPDGQGETLAKWIVQNFKKQKDVSEDAGLINRLDNLTSGIVVAARNGDAYKKLKAAWRERGVLKEYDCLVLGQAPAGGKITSLIAHHPDKSNKMTVATDVAKARELKARRAETEFELVQTFLDYTLLKVRIKGGVRHQIRCHLASIGYPVAGDKLYQRLKHHPRDWLKLPRHFLHASKVGFIHPASGRYVEFTSPLPDELKDALKRLA